jgi:hypothetical protein
MERALARCLGQTSTLPGACREAFGGNGDATTVKDGRVQVGTEQFLFNQTMLGTKIPSDPSPSTETCLSRFDFPAMQFALYFIACLQA